MHAGMPDTPRDQADTPPRPGRHPPDQADPPGSGRPPPGPGRHPPRIRQTPLDQVDPPREADSSIRSTSGRYASYWNAFLFFLVWLHLKELILLFSPWRLFAAQARNRAGKFDVTT